MTLAIFLLCYLGVALGRIPRLAIDRTGIALLGAIAMVLTRALSPEEALAAIHIPAMLLLLSISATYAGNLLILGSLANLIVVEQAKSCGIHIRFREYARVGIPVTLVNLLILFAWITLRQIPA